MSSNTTAPPTQSVSFSFICVFRDIRRQSSRPLGCLRVTSGLTSGYPGVSFTSRVTHTYCCSTSSPVEGRTTVSMAYGTLSTFLITRSSIRIACSTSTSSESLEHKYRVRFQELLPGKFLIPQFHTHLWSMVPDMVVGARVLVLNYLL